MPPYTPNSSRAQQRFMFALANRGGVSQQDAEGRARASDYQHLPERKGHTARRAKGHSPAMAALLRKAGA